MNWNATVEYQISANNLVKATYQGSAGVHLVETWNVNAFPHTLGENDPALRAAAYAAPQNYLPYPQFGSINNMSNTATPLSTPARSSSKSASPRASR